MFHLSELITEHVAEGQLRENIDDTANNVLWLFAAVLHSTELR